MSGRAWQIGGLALAGGVGYYMYQAGGDPKAAQKRAEADATKVSNDVKSNLPGSQKEAKKEAEVGAADAGKKLDQFTKDTKDGLNKVDGKLEQYRKDAEKNFDKTAKDTQKELNSAVDKFDKSVSEGADKAKSGISSWFGGGEKK